MGSFEGIYDSYLNGYNIFAFVEDIRNNGFWIRFNDVFDKNNNSLLLYADLDADCSSLFSKTLKEKGSRLLSISGLNYKFEEHLGFSERHFMICLYNIKDMEKMMKIFNIIVGEHNTWIWKDASIRKFFC